MGAALLRPRLPRCPGHRGATDARPRRAPALPPGLLEGRRRGDQLPTVLRCRHPGRDPRRGARRLRRKPRPHPRPHERRSHQRPAGRPPRRPGRPRWLPHPAGRGHQRGVDRRGEDPGARRVPAHLLAGSRNHRLRRRLADRPAPGGPRRRGPPGRAHAGTHRGRSGGLRPHRRGGQARGHRRLTGRGGRPSGPHPGLPDLPGRAPARPHPARPAGLRRRAARGRRPVPGLCRSRDAPRPGDGRRPPGGRRAGAPAPRAGPGRDPRPRGRHPPR